nr:MULTISPECIES: flavin reductase family protein [Streptomyces]
MSLPARQPTAPHDVAAPSLPHPEGVSEEEFRSAMARLAGGVVLVTAHDEDDGPAGAPAGMTATAFLSVSLSPPLVLVSVRSGSRMDDVLERAPRWAASLLSQEQRVLAGRFAMSGRLSDRLLFREVPHTLGERSGAPLVKGALATLECETESRVAAGDHTLVIGRVLDTTLDGEAGEPLLYYRGAYRRMG